MRQRINIKVCLVLVLIGIWGGGSTATELAAQQQSGVIRGVVVDASRAAVTDADVSIVALGRRARVDDAGEFTFTDVPPGRYVLEGVSPRRGRGTETVLVEPGDTARLTLVLQTVFHLDELIVSAGAAATRRSEAYQPASVMTSRELVAGGDASLGETLSGEPGVTSTYFGPGSSRPVIRGIGGDRVRILEGGVGSGDASSTSPDHAVALEARTAERIEIIRGPATLLYGSSAVGGVVNVIDGRIARELPTRVLSGFVEGLAGSVADERTGTANVTGRAGPAVLTLSGLWRDANDYAIPGVAKAEESPAGDADDMGVLENSALETRRGGAGLTLVGDRGYVGFAWSDQGSRYGVPGDHGDEEAGEGPEGEEEPGVTIDLEQTRYDVEGALRFGSSAVRNLRVRVGMTDYAHVELEGEEVGTRFFNDYVEARIESEHALAGSVEGAVGLQYASRDFEARGDEAFVPPSETRTFALFGYEEWTVAESLRLQGGARFERQSAGSPRTGVDRDDEAVSLSVGASWEAADPVTLALSTSRSVKLPNAEELFSNGPHAATRAFEIGDPALSAETALSLDLTAHLHGERFRASASVFTTGFSDYIHERATGDLEDGLEVFRYTQGDARFTGFELEGEIDVVEGDGVASPHLSLDLQSDYVRAKLTDLDENLPRIPAFRIGAGGTLRHGHMVADVFARRTAEQQRTAPFEEPTPGYTMLDATVSYRIFTGDVFHDLTLAGTNLLDQEARLHTSFLKELAPLPGREIRLVYRLGF